MGEILKTKIKLLLVSLVCIPNLNALTLEEGLKTAIEKDVEIQNRKVSLKKIKYDIKSAQGMNYPTVDLSGQMKTSAYSEDSLTPDKAQKTDTDYLGVEIRQKIYDGGDAKYEKSIQKHRYTSAEYYLNEAINDFILSFIQSYIDLLKAKDSLVLYSESYQINEKIFNKIKRKVDKGFGTKLEYETAKSRLDESLVNVTIQNMTYKDTKTALKFFLQKDFDSTELIKPIFSYAIPQTKRELIEKALDIHPSIDVALLNINVQMSEYQKTNKEFYPSLNFVGKYGINNVTHKEDGVDEYNDYELGIELAYNLYNGGRDTANKSKALESVSEKKLLLEQARREVKNKAELAWNSYILNQEKLDRLYDFLEAREYILEATMQEFDLGTKDLSALTDAHLDYIDTKRNMINTSYDLLLAKYKILDAMGVLKDTILGEEIDQIKFGLNKQKQNKLLKRFSNELKYSYKTKNVLEKIDSEVIDEDVKKLFEVEVKESPKTVKKVYNSFKEKFLDANSAKYTINLATSYSFKKAKQDIEAYRLKDKAFVFKFGADKTYYKTMYGVFDTYSDAQKALKNLHSDLKSNKPLIEIISLKQDLYHKYNSKKGN